MTDQPLLNFYPPPMISGTTNVSGRDVWYDRRRCAWTTDPEDLFLSNEALLAKYGPATSSNLLPEDRR